MNTAVHGQSSLGVCGEYRCTWSVWSSRVWWEQLYHKIVQNDKTEHFLTWIEDDSNGHVNQPRITFKIFCYYSVLSVYVNNYGHLTLRVYTLD